MSAKIPSRLTEPLIAAAIVGAALFWAERNIWSEISTLRAEMNVAQIERLAAADRPEAERFVTDINATLTGVQRFLFLSVLGLLVSGTGVLVWVYRRMITPLRTGLTESQAIIERQEKLASLGVFAAGIAHEIRNPLTAIKVRLFSLKASHRPGSSESDDLEVIESELNRMERIVQDFLRFARPAEPEFQVVPVDRFLRDVHQLVGPELRKRGIEMNLDL